MALLAINHGDDPSPESLALDLYAALLDGSGLPQVLERIAALLGAASYAALVTEYDGQQILRGSAVAHGNLDPARMAEYGRHWVHQDPWWQAALRHGPGVLNMTRLVSPRIFTRTAFWNDFLRAPDAPFHALGAHVHTVGDVSAALALHRPMRQEPFDTREEKVLGFLYPHIQRVLVAQARLNAAEWPLATAAGLDALTQGVAVLSAEGRLVLANAALQAMAAREDGFTLDRQGIFCAGAGARHAVTGAVNAAQAAASGKVRLLPDAGSFAIPRPSGAPPWLVQALPLRQKDGECGFASLPRRFTGVLLLVIDTSRRQAPSQGLLRRLFGLSAAEAALAAAMAEGKSVAAIAQMRGVLPGSLRSQLTAIRRKTGCGSQADLAVLLARVGG
jgi:DNA-binding CsgD family transcriptional regulator